MGKDTVGGASLPTLAEEWAKAREVIEKADDRVQETRKMVFGLFSTLLAASAVIGKERSSDPKLWLGLHLALLGLLVAGRFVEQQTFLLQAAAASRAWVLELLTPVELTGMVCDRFASIRTDESKPLGKRNFWAQRTSYIYGFLGFVSAIVTGLITLPSLFGGADSYVLAFVLSTGGYALLVGYIGKQDITFARRGRDWSFSATSARVGEPVHILLVNQENDDLPVEARPAKVIRILGPDGDPAGGESSDAFDLPVPPGVLANGKLHHRGALRWVWKPARPGLWGLRVEVPEHDPPRVWAPRFIYVEPAPVTAVARGERRLHLEMDALT